MTSWGRARRRSNSSRSRSDPGSPFHRRRSSLRRRQAGLSLLPAFRPGAESSCSTTSASPAATRGRSRLSLSSRSRRPTKPSATLPVRARRRSRVCRSRIALLAEMVLAGRRCAIERHDTREQSARTPRSKSATHQVCVAALTQWPCVNSHMNNTPAKPNARPKINGSAAPSRFVGSSTATSGDAGL